METSSNTLTKIEEITKPKKKAKQPEHEPCVPSSDCRRNFRRKERPNYRKKPLYKLFALNECKKRKKV